MEKKTAPLLSIGMIFKNEARCLERCLKSLQPLRQAIPCELVMADTGSTDGSRAIAEQYADEVFGFKWIDDFAAARNAVMDRCSGEWYFSVDSDEWLDADISELLSFLNHKGKMDFALIRLRNYRTKDLELSEDFQDFYALRLTRMAAGERFHGAIHETWQYKDPSKRLSRTLLHHDGYCFENPQKEKDKQNRNMLLLRKKLEQEPESLRTLIECIESGGNDPNLIEYVRRAVGIVQKKRDQWMRYGACIMRHAAEVARTHELPELDDWIKLAQTQFSDSIFTKIDLYSTAFLATYKSEDWAEAIKYGEKYLEGMCDLAKKTNQVETELECGILHAGNPVSKRTIQIGLANCYLQVNQSKKALNLLVKLSGEKLYPDQGRNAIIVLCTIHAQSKVDISSTLHKFYDQISQPVPNGQRQAERIITFNMTAAAFFTSACQNKEQKHKHWHRPAYTAFACLADRCEAGRGAKIMMTSDPAEMRKWLLQVENWQALPIEALEHALASGVAFPLPEKPLNQETMSGLATQLTHGENTAWQLALALPEAPQEYPTLQCLLWTQSVVLAALRSFDWMLGEGQKPTSEFYCPEKKKDEAPDKRPECTPKAGLALTRRFAALEAAALPLLYTPQLLTEENAALLPPMHRWGFYCARAFAALDAGDPQGYLAALRKGLAACPGEKGMVQFLLDRFLEDARPKASPELLALADRVRAILAAYSPDDPAVAALRESPAYRQVAWLIDAGPGQSLPDALVQ